MPYSKIEREVYKELEDNPVTSSEYRNLVLGENELDSKTKQELWEYRNKLSEMGMIKPDVKETFADFSKRKKADGELPIKASTMKQANSDDFDVLQSKKMAIYPDVPINAKISSMGPMVPIGPMRSVGSIGPMRLVGDLSN